MIRARRWGGWRQSLSHPTPDDLTDRPFSCAVTDPNLKPSRLALSLLSDWSFGVLSSPHLKKHAKCAVDDGMVHAHVIKLASIGGDTPNSQNCHRQLMNMLLKEPFRKLVSRVEGDSPIKFCIQPHLLLNFLLSHFRTHTTRSFGFSEALCLRFWTGLWESESGRDIFETHPDLQGKTPPDLIHTLPLTIHEDAGPFTKRLSMNTISWGCCIGTGTELETKNIFAAHVKEKGSRLSTQDPGFRMMVDSFAVMASGVGPRLDNNQHEFPSDSAEFLLRNNVVLPGVNGEPWSTIVLFGKADMEAATVGWGLKSYNAGDECCGYCGANRTTRPFTDLQETALWRPTTIVSLERFLERIQTPHHPLIDARFFTRYFVRIDIMHNLDHKGVASTVAGSIILPLIKFETRLGSNQHARLDALNSRLHTWQCDHRTTVRMPPIDLANLTITGAGGSVLATLHGPLVKAANTRHIVPWLRSIAFEFFDGSSQEHSSIRKVIDSLCVVYMVLYQSEMFLTVLQKKTLRDAILKFGRHYQWLNAEARRTAGSTWATFPKTHAMQHLPDQADLINPRCVQNYAEESLIGKTSLMWKAAVNGPWRRTVQRTVLVKYCFGRQLICAGYY